MTEWYERAYPGGPGLTLPGFPRPLHYPGQAGYAPSAPGPDCVAWKRFVSRLGRWPWQTFDDVYSEGFALGRGPNVRDSGVAGVQRQQPELEETGAIGEAFYHFARHALIPDELPHGGEYGLDATAQELLADAYALFGPSSSSGPLTRERILSPNYSSRGGSAVRLIVLHTAEGALTIESLGAFFADPASDVSSHVGIDDQAGRVGEYVYPDGKAWTAANANPYSVQAELCGFAEWSGSEWGRHPNMIENAGRWVAEEAERFDIPLTVLSASSAQSGGRGVCQHVDLGAAGGGHWDCGSGLPIGEIMEVARGA